MCHHSYHQRCALFRDLLAIVFIWFIVHYSRCLADNEAECPNCAREHGVIREIRINNARLADQHDVFLSEVQEGGFEVVAAAFGRGVLNKSGPGDR